MKTEEIKAILEGAKKAEGATHYAQDMHYLALAPKGWMRYDPNGFEGAKWFDAKDYKLDWFKHNFNSLSDLREILQLRQERDELAATNSLAYRLVEELTPYADFALQTQMFNKLIPAANEFLKATPSTHLSNHNAEMMARGIEDLCVVKEFINPDEWIDHALDYANQIRKQEQNND